jgi:6-phosphofructokinase 1
MKVSVLTGGGDAPGLNAYLKAITFKAIDEGYEVYGFLDGWKGVLENKYIKLSKELVEKEYFQGGTLLGSSRTNPAKNEETINKAINNFKATGFDVLIAIGGEDTMGASSKMFKAGIPVIGLPKTIDYDLYGTDFTVGFYTAVDIVRDSIEKLISTAKSHHRVIVVEVMGRHAGWIALYGGLAGGANYIIIPEFPLDLSDLIRVIKDRYNRGQTYAIVVVAEGVELGNTNREVVDEYGHVKLGGVGEQLAKIIEKETGITTRSVNLGHLQRGGPANSIDRIFPLRLGYQAIELVKNKEFGKMLAIKGNEIVKIDLSQVEGKIKTVDKELYDFAKSFFY